MITMGGIKQYLVVSLLWTLKLFKSLYLKLVAVLSFKNNKIMIIKHFPVYSVTATSQHVPEALQKWHETTKNLEQNHSMLVQHIAELQKKILSVSSDVDLLKEQIEQQQKGTSSDERFQTLQGNLADLGARMQGFDDRVNKLDADMGSHELYFNSTLDLVKNRLDQVVNKPAAKGVEDVTLQRLNDFDKTLNQRIEALFNNVTVEGGQLKTRIDQLEKDFSSQTVS